MKDDLKNNIPSAELENISASPEQQNLSEQAAEIVKTNSEVSEPAVSHKAAFQNASSPENKYPPDTTSKTPRTNTLRNKTKSSHPYNDYYTNSYPQNGYQYQNGNAANNTYPRTNTLRNRTVNQQYNYANAYSQSASNTPYPRTNTLRNRNPEQQYSYGNPYPQSAPNTATNTPYPRTNTLRNRNPEQQYSYSNPYPQSAPNTTPNAPYPRTNTLRNRNPEQQYSYGNPYPQSAPNTTPNAPYPRNNTLRNRNANQHYNYGYPNYQYPPQAYSPYPPNVYIPSQPYYGGFPAYYEPDPKETERLALARDCSKAGAATIAIFIVMFVVAMIIEVVGVLCGVVQDIPDLSKDPYAGFTPMGFYMYEGLTSLLSVFFPSLIIMKTSGKKLSQLVPFTKIKGKKLASIVMCGMSLCMVAQLMATLIGINFGLFGIDIYKGLETATATGVLDLIMSTICTALIPALVEEFAYRGLVAGILKDHDEALAVFASAFLFGMLHGNFAQIPFAFVVGLVLGYVRIKTDSMLPGILIHFGNNFYAVVITILSEILPEPYATLVDVAVVLILIVAGFISANYLTKNHKELFRIEKKPSLLTYKEKLHIFMKSGTVIASIVILTIMSFVVLWAV